MNKEEKNYELIKFIDGDFNLDVRISPEENTVWLTANQMAELFGKDVKTIRKHIDNILKEHEGTGATVAKFEIVQMEGNRRVTRTVEHYNIDTIVSIGYRVKSKRIDSFRDWTINVINNFRNKNVYSKPLIVFRHDNISLDVSVDPNEETVWLNQKQIAILFDTSVDNVSLHIKNILNENELDSSVFEESSITASNGKTYKIKLYNLDMILAIGYRVKSKNAIIFRKWATYVLKDYLLKGYAINEDRLNIYRKMSKLEIENTDIIDRLNNLENIVYGDNNKLIYEGEILEPFIFLRKLFFLAKKI